MQALAAWTAGLFLAGAGAFFAQHLRASDWQGLPKRLFAVALPLFVAAHVLSVAWLIARDRSPALVALCTAAYACLAVAWLPLSRRVAAGGVSKVWLQLLLAVSAAPLGGVAYVGWKAGGWVRVVALWPPLHVLFLDNVVYMLWHAR